MPASIYSLAPINLVVNDGVAVVLPCEGHSFSADILANPHFHTGNTAPTQITVPGANPKLKVNIPFKAAFDVLGLGIVKLTTLDVYLSKYLDFAREAAATLHHVRLSLTTGAFAAAQITDWSVSVDGILMAEVSIDLLSDDQTNPFQFDVSQALPTLSANPQLHTLGPVKINGTIIPGATSSGGSIAGSTIMQRSDGDMYPRVGARVQITPVARIEHTDPSAVLVALGLLGASITTTTELYFKSYDATTGVVDVANSVKITIGLGRITPDGWQATQGAVATTGFVVQGIVADGVTNPFAVVTNATTPTVP